MTNNFLPEQVIHQKISLSTIRVSDGIIVQEPHDVNWIPVTFNMPLNTIALPTSSAERSVKYVVPLTDPNGRFFIKFHFPLDSSDMYITYCEKHAEMADGYWDYRTLVKQEFIDEFHIFVRDGRELKASMYPYSKTLKFSAYGTDTNQSSIAVQFSVEFKSLNGGLSADGGNSGPADPRLP